SPADGRTDATCCSCYQHNAARELALWRRKLELVLLQRPVFDSVALSVRERDKTATCLCPTHDIDGAMRELGRDVGHQSVFASGKHAHAGDENDSWVWI